MRRMLTGKRTNPSRLAVLAVVALMAVALGCQRGGTFPARPVTLIIPLEAGSAPDVNFRVLAQQAEQQLGQKVVVVNRPGGGGSVGSAEVIQAQPDGYTIGMAGVAMLTIQPVVTGAPYKGPQDVAPIIQVTEAPMVLSIRNDAPWKTLDDFLTEARARPGAIRVGMANRFDILHVELERFQELSGAKFTIVPFGAGQQIPALLGGTADAAVSQPTIVIPHLETGKLRMLAVFGDEPLKNPDVATFKSQGYDIPDIPYEFLFAPKGTPQDKIQILHDAFKAAMESKAFKQQVEKTKIRIAYLSGPELAKKLEESARVHAELAQKLGWRR